MSLSSRLLDLATRVATEAKALRTLINGNAVDLAALTTTSKTNLVAAINEIAAAVADASGIDDNVTSTSTAWSSSKTSGEIAEAVDDAMGLGMFKRPWAPRETHNLVRKPAATRRECDRPPEQAEAKNGNPSEWRGGTAHVRWPPCP